MVKELNPQITTLEVAYHTNGTIYKKEDKGIEPCGFHHPHGSSVVADLSAVSSEMSLLNSDGF